MQRGGASQLVTGGAPARDWVYAWLLLLPAAVLLALFTHYPAIAIPTAISVANPPALLPPGCAIPCAIWNFT